MDWTSKVLEPQAKQLMRLMENCTGKQDITYTEICKIAINMIDVFSSNVVGNPEYIMFQEHTELGYMHKAVLETAEKAAYWLQGQGEYGLAFFLAVWAYGDGHTLARTAFTQYVAKFKQHTELTALWQERRGRFRDGENGVSENSCRIGEILLDVAAAERDKSRPDRLVTTWELGILKRVGVAFLLQAACKLYKTDSDDGNYALSMKILSKVQSV